MNDTTKTPAARPAIEIETVFEDGVSAFQRAWVRGAGSAVGARSAVAKATNLPFDDLRVIEVNARKAHYLVSAKSVDGYADMLRLAKKPRTVMSNENNTPGYELLTNGRAFAACIDDVVILPNGRAVSIETAENMGFEDCEEGKLTPACLEGVEKHNAILKKAKAATGRGDVGYDPYAHGKVQKLIVKNGKSVGVVVSVRPGQPDLNPADYLWSKHS